MIPFLLAASLTVPTAEPAPVSAPKEVPLRFRTQREFALALPAETWSPLAASIPGPGGTAYPVTLAGASLRVDTDGDGTHDVEVAGKEGLVTLRGAEGEVVHAIRVRNTREGWRWSTSGSKVGKLGNVKVQLIDQNNNGRYDDVGEDAMIVGRGRDACFLSEVVCVGGQLLRITPAADGSTLAFEEFAGETGELDLVSACDSDAKLAWAVVKSEDGRYSFDLSKAKEGQPVPAGSYVLERGRVALGTNHAQIHRGRSKPMVVPAGGTLELDWGGPVEAEFGFQRSGAELKFSPSDIDYYGAFGELYKDFLPLGKSPEFSVKEKATGDELVNAKFPGNC